MGPNNDPISLAEGLIGRRLSDAERAQVLASIAQMPPEQPQATPSPDWTLGFAGQLHPLGMSGKRIGGAGAIASSHFLGGVPLVGPELAGAAFGGGLSALADRSPSEIGHAAMMGAAFGGPMSRLAAPLMESAAPAVSKYLGEALGTNDSAVSAALAQDPSMAYPELFGRPLHGQDPEPPRWGSGEPPAQTALNTQLGAQNIPIDQLRGLTQSELYRRMGLESTLNEPPSLLSASGFPQGLPSTASEIPQGSLGALWEPGVSRQYPEPSLASQTPLGVPSDPTMLPAGAFGPAGPRVYPRPSAVGEDIWNQPRIYNDQVPEQPSAVTRDQRMNEMSRLNQIPRSFSEELADSIMERMGRASASRSVRPPAELRLPASPEDAALGPADASADVGTRPQRPPVGDRRPR